MKEYKEAANIHRRIRRLIGQLEGIDRMVKGGAVCEDILIQANAAKSAVHQIAQVVLREHMENTLKQAAEAGSSSQMQETLDKALELYSRI